MTNKNIVYLVNAANDTGMSAIANDYSFPALGVLALGTWLKKRMPELEVIVRDGGVHSHEKIIEDIYDFAPSLVGISVLGTSYQNALEIAETAKCFGATTVFGNDQAAQLSRKILKNRPVVDYVIGSEYGEESLELLVKRELLGENIALESIPHLTWSDGIVRGFDYGSMAGNLSIMQSRLNSGRKRDTALDVFPIVDRTLYPKEHWETYLRNYLSKFSAIHNVPVTGVTTMNRARGCSRAKDKCKFCDMYLDPVSSSPEMFWQEVKSANEQVQANIFYEVCDSLSSFPRFLERVAESRPNNLGFEPQFFVYAQARELIRNPEIIRYFKEIGVFRVNVGLESFSDKTLQHMKGIDDSVDKNFGALRMLRDAEIFVYGSLVLGSEAEDKKTLEETYQGVRKALDEGLIHNLEVQPVLPLPNNEYGKRLYRVGLFPGGNDSDWPINTNEISQVYIDNFSGVNYSHVMEYRDKILAYANKKGIIAGSGVLKEK